MAPNCNAATAANIPHTARHPLSRLAFPPAMTTSRLTRVTRSITTVKLMRMPVVCHMLQMAYLSPDSHCPSSGKWAHPLPDAGPDAVDVLHR